MSGFVSGRCVTALFRSYLVATCDSLLTIPHHIASYRTSCRSITTTAAAGHSGSQSRAQGRASRGQSWPPWEPARAYSRFRVPRSSPALGVEGEMAPRSRRRRCDAGDRSAAPLARGRLRLERTGPRGDCFARSMELVGGDWSPAWPRPRRPPWRPGSPQALGGPALRTDRGPSSHPPARSSGSTNLGVRVDSTVFFTPSQPSSSFASTSLPSNARSRRSDSRRLAATP